MKAKQKPRKEAARSRVWMAMGSGGAALLVFSGVFSARFEPVAPVGTLVWGMDAGGSNRAEVESLLEKKWADFAQRKITFEHDGKPFGSVRSVAELGLSLDREGTLARVPFQGVLGVLRERLDAEKPEANTILPVLRIERGKLEPLASSVRAALGRKKPARVRLVRGQIERTFEDAGLELDVDGMLASVSEALLADQPARLPLVPAATAVTPEDLAKIDGAIGTFTTSFSEGNRPRAGNIRVAAARIDGTVLMPGETFSFNGLLGRRTQEKGYQVAGVYVAGRHDVDVGGGICQVSTTLFNAALLGGLDIASRSPHSLPVPYVPRGRDAAVSFPLPDLALKNPYDFPIALCASVAKGKITFTVLGTKAAKPKVEISQSTVSSWSRGVKYVEDKGLAPGTSRVEDRGGSGSKAVTTRTVTDPAGKSRVQTFESIYSGGPTIIRRNSSARKPAKPAVKAPVPVGGSAEPPAVTPPAEPGSAAAGLG
ncbi:MAG: VanW family protein [Fimbriimonadaceae bacterium]|nr:VanW family protein [Fimbriimonadaceae bacterium]